jgi:topoisomerase-4 subunit A
LRKDEANLHKLLGSEPALRKQAGKELDEDGKKFGDGRRTLIETAERAAVEAKVIDEPVTVVISDKGFVRARQGHGHDATQMSFKPGDALYGAYECRTVDQLVALGSNGRVYSVPVALLPAARGDGAPVTSMIELDAGTRLVAYVAGAPSQPLLLATSAGFGFACVIENMLSRQKGGKQFITVEQGAVPLRPALVDPATDDRIVCLSEKGRLLTFAASEIKQQSGGGRGVTLMGLDEGEKMLAAVSCGKLGVVVTGLKGTSGKPTEVPLGGRALAAHEGSRARKGTLVQPKLKEPSLRKLLPLPVAT